VNGNWRKRYNEVLMQMFVTLDMLSFVGISRLNWMVMLIEWTVQEKQVKYLTIILKEDN
jgi:hypothetical protein